jgi:hypothetical protein
LFAVAPSFKDEVGSMFLKISFTVSPGLRFWLRRFPVTMQFLTELRASLNLLKIFQIHHP